MNSMDELMSYFALRNNGEYSRENYDKFIKDNKLSFSFPSVHITGTNGKGSTANFIKAIYIDAGYKVGFYNSPYFYSPCELCSVNNTQIADEEFLAIFNEYKTSFEKYNLSEFEMETIISFIYFQRNNIDIAIIEVGMGGEIDATNVLNNTLLSIITSISLEHTAYLGTTVSEIAYSKSGIIKPKSKVLIGDLDAEAKNVIAQVARKEESKLFEVSEAFNPRFFKEHLLFDYQSYKDLRINSNALYQTKNAILAIDAVNLISDVFAISEDNIRNGLQTKILQGRMEYLMDNVVIDGGHNVEAIFNLLISLEKSNNKPINCLFAAFRDKNIDGMLALLNRDCEKVTITSFDHKRARTKDEYFLYLFDFEFADDYKAWIDDMIANHKDELILITGSLAFVSVVRKYIKEKYRV